MNFSKTLWPIGWALGQATWAKMTLKLLHLWHHSQKICAPNLKNFFRVQSTRLADPFELFSAIGRGARALVRQPKTAVFLAEIEVRIYHTPVLKVLSYSWTSCCQNFSWSTTGVYSYTTPVYCSAIYQTISVKHGETSRWCFFFSFDGRRLLHSSSCLLVIWKHTW